jgi:uncharacterized protein (TIGR00266 family)
MITKIEGAPSFAYLHVDLEPGESIRAESDAMASMDAELDMKAEFNGGFFDAILRRLFGGESLFVNVFTNNTPTRRRLTLVQASPGDLKEIPLAGSGICLQRGAYLASTTTVAMSVKWAGIASFLAREGLFKLYVHGQGKVWFGGYGGILFKDVQDALLIDSGHIVAYEPQLKIKLQLAGGIFSSFFGGEGVVARVEGKGKVAIQTRSLEGLASFLNPKLH